MAIAEMSRMRLVGVKREEEKILSALHKTCAVQIISRESVPTEGAEKNEFVEKYDRLSFACSFLTDNVNRISKDDKKVSPVKEELYGVGYDEFISALDLEEKVFPVIEKIDKINEEITDRKAKIAVLTNEYNQYKPFYEVKPKFSCFCDTEYTKVFLGTVKPSAAHEFAESDVPCEVNIECEDGLTAVISVVCHKTDENGIIGALSSYGFVRVSFNGDFTAKEKCDALMREIDAENSALKQLDEEIVGMRDSLRDMKVLSDRYMFEIEKGRDKDGFETTASTFLLDAYVPTEATERVSEALNETTDAVFYEFTPIGEDEFAPTLMKNNKVVRQFEFVTNLYSPPKYGTIDQNAVMSVFFSVFMGFIMGDAGYGVLMMLGGFLLAKKIGRDTGTARLSNVIAIGGIFSLIFGILFDSFFGYGLLRGIGIIDSPFMPDAVNDKMSISGISVPKLLMLSLGMGVVQIMASLALKAAASFKHGEVLDGILDSFTWIFFLAALILLVLGLSGYIEGVTEVAAIVAVVSVALGAIGSARHGKGFGKVTKGFSALYGLINYMSDILSYARLYGLMLSGAQIASIVTSLAVPLMTTVPGAIGGVLILIVGHAFNLAMSILGGFIHDARLQYIEFYGRFYEGDGELFQPFGTKFANTYFAVK